MVNQLTIMEIVLDDELLALLLLSSLPNSWETSVVSLSNYTPNGKLTFDMVKDSLLNEEIRRKGSNKVISSSQNEALFMKSIGRNIYKNSQKFNNCSQRFNDCSKSRGKSRPKTNITCFHCNKLGHVIKDCWFLKREKSMDRRNNYNKREDKDETTTAFVSDGEVVIVYEDDSINLSNQEYEWVVAYAASFHVIPHHDYFTSYTVVTLGM